MSPYDTPTALTVITAAAIAFVVWAVWVTRDAARIRRAHRRAPGTRSRAATPLRCHVTGCPFPARVPVHRTLGGRWTVLHVCHGHADEGQAKGWWHREQLRQVAS